MGTDEILFTLVPVPRNGARVLPLEAVPVPGHNAQIFARALTKSSVQTSSRAREPGTAPGLNGALDRQLGSLGLGMRLNCFFLIMYIYLIFIHFLITVSFFKMQ